MDFHEHLKLKKYNQSLYQRVQIATAVAVIKITPNDKTPENFAASLQAGLRLQWFRSVKSNDRLFQPHVEQQILKQQQQALASRLHSVVPVDELQQHPQNKDDSMEELEWYKVDENNASSPKDDSYPYNYFSSVNCEEVQSNSEFIRSVLQLKALIELHTTIPASRYIQTVPKFSFKQDTCNVSLGTQSCILLTDSDSNGTNVHPDSGIGSYDEKASSEEKNQRTPVSKVSGVASSVLNYIIRSCNAEELVIKSVEAIFCYLKRFTSNVNTVSLMKMLQHTTTNWKGSILEHALETVHKVLDSNLQENNVLEQVCITYVIELACDVITVRIISKDDLYIKEIQCGIILHLCKRELVCVSTLEFLVEKIQHLGLVLQNCGANSPELESSKCEAMDSLNILQCDSKEPCLGDFTERSYFMLHLMKELLTQSKSIFSETDISSMKYHCRSSRTQHAAQQSKSIVGLWRKRYVAEIENTKSSHKENEKKSTNTKKFDCNCQRQRLESVFTAIHENPLISIAIWECINQLPTYDDE